jgi:hypothetical protein
VENGRFEVKFGGDAGFRGIVEPIDGRGESAKQAFAVGELEMFECRGGKCNVPEKQVLNKEPEGGKHAVTLSLKGPRVPARGGSTALPKNRGGRSDAPAKGAPFCGTAVVDYIERRRIGLLQMCLEGLGVACGLQIRE